MKLIDSEFGKFLPIKTDKGIYYGGYQNSLEAMGVSKFYRDRSCVVTAFTNAYLYMYEKNKKFTLEEYNYFHYDFYKKLTPHINGVPTVLSLDRRVNKIRLEKKLSLISHIKEEFIKKAPLTEKIDFINEALSKDLPVIFINWLSSQVKVLSHHGVVITELNDMGNYHELVVSSRGRLYRINFNEFDKQFRTYTGLIYFER